MKKILYILCMLMASLMFTACSSDDLVENETMKIGHDEKGNYIDVTISAEAPVASPETRGIGNATFMDRAWRAGDKIVILLNGYKSELKITTQIVQPSHVTSANFSGRLYYGDILPNENTVLRAYVLTYYTQVNDDGSYTMLNPTDLNYGSAGNSERNFNDHGIYYAETTYGTGSNIVFNFKPKTACIYIDIKDLPTTFVTASDYAEEFVYFSFLGRGLFNSGETAVEGFDYLAKINGGYNFSTIVDTRSPISRLSFKMQLPDGRAVYRNLKLTSDEVRLLPGKIYKAEFDPYPRIGDYLYEDGSWGDVTSKTNSATATDGKSVVGIVFSTEHQSNYYQNSFGDLVSDVFLPPLAVALKDASTGMYYTTTTPSFPDEYRRSAKQIVDNQADNDFEGTYSRSVALAKKYPAPDIAMKYSDGSLYDYEGVNWYLPSAGEMGLLAQNLYGSNLTVSATNAISLSTFDRNRIKTSIDNLNGSVGNDSFVDLNGNYWTSTFSSNAGSVNAYAAQFSTNSGAISSHGASPSGTSGAKSDRVRAITQFGYVRRHLNK